MRRFLTQTADTLATRTSHQQQPQQPRIGHDEDAAFGVKLLALIRELFCTAIGGATVGTGTGNDDRAGLLVHRQREPPMTDDDSKDEEDVDTVIDRPDGWEFAYEGGAHILFRHVSEDTRFDGKLLRLAKRNKHTLPTLEKYEAFHDTFLPLLTPANGESLVVHTTLVKITPDVIRTLQLQQVVPNTKRMGILNTEDNYGTLLEDLSADPSCLLLDFKVLPEHAYSWTQILPKWLSQSPRAPWNANTCRTCALRRLRRNATKSNPRFCPLDLSSGKPERIQRAITTILQDKGLYNPLLSRLITEHLLCSSLIPTLLRAQTSPSSSLATKMTLRDCTLFVQIPRERFQIPSEATATTENPAIGEMPRAREIRIVIADLDKKDREIRGEYWRSIEAQLIQGGYYTGQGKIEEEMYCDLRDVVWTSDQVVWNHCTV